MNRKQEAPEDSLNIDFIPNPINSLSFNDKPVISDNDTCRFFFKEYEGSEIWLSIQKDKDYNYQWLNDTKPVNRIRPHKQGLHLAHPTRDKELSKDLTSKLSIPEDIINDYLEELGLFLNDHEQELYEDDVDPGAEDPENGQEQVYQSFQDYPKDIQEQALKIIKEGRALEFMENVIYTIHLGDTKAKNLILLSVGSLFVKNSKPVHQALKGGSGVGKSDLAIATLKVFPKRYLQFVRDSSPKYIYYESIKDTFNPNYNIFLFDDIVLSESLIELSKSLTDNIDNDKTLKTVIDQESKDLSIPGKLLCIYTLAKEIQDVELNNRLLYNNPKEDDDHSQKVKKRIRTQEITGSGFDSPDIQELYLICQAMMDKLTEKPIKVYNPYLEFMELDDKNFRDISHFSNLVKARSLFYQDQRYRIDDMIIGNLEDFEAVKGLWDSIATLQKYKIDAKQIKLLKLLEPYSEDSYKLLKTQYDEDQRDFMEDETIPRYSNLAKKLGFTQAYIRQWVDGKNDSEKIGLEAMGLVKKVKIAPDVRTSPTILYLNPENPTIQNEFCTKPEKGSMENPGNPDLPLKLLETNEKYIAFDTLESKRSIIIHGYTLVTNSQTLYRKKIIDHILSKHPKPLKSDKDIYEILNTAKEVFEKELKNQDNDVSKLSPEDKLKNILFNLQDSVSSVTSSKVRRENSLNQDQRKNNIDTYESSNQYEDEKVKEGHISGIPVKTLKICYGIIKHKPKGINKINFNDSIMNRLDTEDPGSIVKQLIKEGFIEIDNTGTIIKPKNKLLKLYSK